MTALVEWPVVYDSGFEPEFLVVPPECLILTMQQNQKYFALNDANGAHCSTVSCWCRTSKPTNPEAIVAGNARVVRARLADAKFFYDQDRKQTLESRVTGLANVVYHNKLGLAARARRTRDRHRGRASRGELGLDVTHVERAARLAKADLRTLMVGEFPELQGIMGEYYARHDGEAGDVALAIREHYQPRFAGDAVPSIDGGHLRCAGRQARDAGGSVRDRRKTDRRDGSVCAAPSRARRAAHAEGGVPAARSGALVDRSARRLPGRRA